METNAESQKENFNSAGIYWRPRFSLNLGSEIPVLFEVQRMSMLLKEKLEKI